MTRHPIALFALFAAMSCALILPASAEVYEAPGICLEVSDDAPLGIISVKASPDGPALYTDPETVETTWELVMVDAGGNDFKVDPVSRNLAGQTSEADGAFTMVWDAAEIPGGTVKVTCT